MFVFKSNHGDYVILIKVIVVSTTMTLVIDMADSIMQIHLSIKSHLGYALWRAVWMFRRLSVNIHIYTSHYINCHDIIYPIEHESSQYFFALFHGSSICFIHA